MSAKRSDNKHEKKSTPSMEREITLSTKRVASMNMKNEQ
jgi:hypothetical protein